MTRAAVLLAVSMIVGPGLAGAQQAGAGPELRDPELVAFRLRAALLDEASPQVRYQLAARGYALQAAQPTLAAADGVALLGLLTGLSGILVGEVSGEEGAGAVISAGGVAIVAASAFVSAHGYGKLAARLAKGDPLRADALKVRRAAIIEGSGWLLAALGSALGAAVLFQADPGDAQLALAIAGGSVALVGLGIAIDGLVDGLGPAKRLVQALRPRLRTAP